MIKRNAFYLYLQRFPHFLTTTTTHRLIQQRMAPFIITGASGGSPNRIEINDFVRDEKLFSLYIQALRMSITNYYRYILIRIFWPEVMSANDQNIIQSFFQVAGIHGLPNQPWDGVVGSTPFDPNSGQWGGYCTHGSVLFPTWHRPYVMLYEVCPTSFLLSL